MIKSQLSDLMDKQVPGKILISPYLDFNAPDAMRELLKLKNVEVRLTPKKIQMHAKFYFFEHTGKQVLISGSSNLTHTSLKINYEWNIKLTSTHNGEFVQNTKSEFDRIWEQSELLTPEIIETYAKKRKKIIEAELPRFAVTITHNLENDRDVVKILSSYRRVAGPELGHELDVTIADMVTGNYENALLRFQNRIGSTMLSDIIRGLIGTLRGDDQQMFFKMLTFDMRQIEQNNLKKEAAKRPKQMQKYSMMMLFCILLI